MTEREPGADTTVWRLKPAADVELPPGESWRSLKREPGLFSAIVGFGFWSFVRLYLRIAHRLRVEGRENLPRRAPFVLIANHSSHLDALTLGSVLRSPLRCHTYPMAAGDTFFVSPPIAAFAALFLNALPMWRDSTGQYGLRQLRDRLTEEPCGLIVFPEGTRSRTGQLGRFKPGIGVLVAGGEVPVIPCHLEGAHGALPPGRRVPRWKRLTLRIGEPRSFVAESNDRDGWRRVVDEARAEVERMDPSFSE